MKNRFGQSLFVPWFFAVVGMLLVAPTYLAGQGPSEVVEHPDGSFEFFDGRVTPPMPELLSLREQYEIRLEWLETKHELLLPMMRSHNISMWIIVNHEFANDPMTQYVAPKLEYPQRRSVKVFVDGGDEGLKRYSDYWRPTSDYERFFVSFSSLGDLEGSDLTAAGLRALFDRYDPQTIGLNSDVGTSCLETTQVACGRGQSSGLSYDGFRYLEDSMGPEAERRFVSAAGLVQEYSDTRLPEELEHNRDLFIVTDIFAQRTMSNEVITPGVTTIADVKWWFEHQVAELGVGAETWFEVHAAVQRFDAATGEMIDYIHPGPEEYVFQRGDIIHMDWGFNYMGFASDWQKVAYILREGEDDVPEGLKAALANANVVHEAFASEVRPGMTGWKATLAVASRLEDTPFVPSIYTHPIGYQGHALGPSIRARAVDASVQTGTGPADISATMDLSSPFERDTPLLRGSYRSIEFSVSTPVPEFNNGMVAIAMEDGAYLTDEGYRYFSPYQTEWYIIR